MTKFFLLFFISFISIFAQFSDSVTIFEYENSFIMAGYRYSTDLKIGTDSNEIENSKLFGIL